MAYNHLAMGASSAGEGQVAATPVATRAARPGLARAGRQLLDRPGVAVRILEEHEPAPVELLDLADLERALEQLGAGGVGVGHDQLEALTDPGAASVTPVPNAIEHAEPGGVSWTNRSSSETRWSWSAWNPTFST